MKKKIISNLKYYFDLLWPLNRSLTGNDVRKTHKILSSIIPLKTYEIKSGTKVNDWIVPKEWNVKDAYIKNLKGKKLIDFSKNNLHLVGYSHSVNKVISKNKLNNYLHFIKKMPEAIPYKTSYYKKNWGFCLSYKNYKKLKDKRYEVNINAEHKNGSMTISDLFIPGKVKKEIIVHTYTCHPSMAINEISGPLVVAFLAKDILNMKKKYFSYRFIFAPETIGSITYLKKNGKYLKKNLIAGFICTCVGHNSSFTYKRSKLNNSITNIAVEEIFKKTKVKSKVLKFSPSGSDERQYCSIGYNLPIGSLMRVPYGKYKEYHTSLDNKDLISFNGMYETINMYKKIFNYIEKNYDSLNNKKNYFNKIEINLKKKVKKNMLYPVNLITKGEPFLTKHKIRYSVKNHAIADKLTLATKWLIHYSDGKNSLYDISRFSKLDLNILKKSLKYLLKTKIFKVNNSLD